MNIKTAIDNINKATDNAREKILSAYDHLEAKGAIIPADKNLTNLNACIDSIPFEGVYGVVINTASSAFRLQRVGNMNLHKSLPVQSRMRRCLLLDDGTVNYYLDADDSNLKEDGTPAVLDGTDGQVMVEIPLHYRGLRTIDDTHYRVDISLYPFIGAVEVPKMYVSAFEAALDRRESGVIPEDHRYLHGYTYYKLASVVNTSTEFRGGGNTSSWDSSYRSLLGMPITHYNVGLFRPGARLRGQGWNCYEYRCYLAIYWLYVIEYACLDSEQDFMPNLTAEGFHQGGLGQRGKLMDSLDVWKSYNNANPVIPCGFTLELGNHTGNKIFTFDEEQLQKYINAGGTIENPSYSVASYRGIENIAGHIAKLIDGLDFRFNTYSEALRWDNANDYGDYTKVTYSIRLPLLAHSYITNGGHYGYTKAILGGKNADIIIAEKGTTYNYFCGWFSAMDYSSKRIPQVGGSLYLSNDSQQINSMACSLSIEQTGEQRQYYVGTRLCYCSEPNCFKLVE